MMGDIRVKGKRADLIAAIQKKEASCLADYEKAMKRHTLQEGQWAKKAALGLREMAKDIEANPRKYLNSETNGRPMKYRISDITSVPSKPSRPNGATRLLQMLRMGSEESLTLTEEQYRRYMDSCAR